MLYALSWYIRHNIPLWCGYAGGGPGFPLSIPSSHTLARKPTWVVVAKRVQAGLNARGRSICFAKSGELPTDPKPFYMA